MNKIFRKIPSFFVFKNNRLDPTLSELFLCVQNVFYTKNKSDLQLLWPVKKVQSPKHSTNLLRMTIYTFEKSL